MSDPTHNGRYGIQQYGSDGIWSETMIWCGYRRKAEADRVALFLNAQQPDCFRVSDKRAGA